VLLHVIAAFTFALAHGVSAGVALKLRGEREVPRVQALLDLSEFATNEMYVSILVLLVAGVAATFIAGLWGRTWIWAAIVLFGPDVRRDVCARLDMVPRSAPRGRSSVRDGKGRTAGGAA
jgi:hypothetical protein